MKLTNQLTNIARLFSLTLLGGALGVLAPALRAQDQTATPKSGTEEKAFSSPDEAVNALKAASQAGDQSALQEIFGPQYHELLTGDKVQDANNASHFAAALADHCEQVKQGDDTITLEIGTNDWPYPIPLVKTDNQWHFDTAAGKEEIISRHIGKDELNAIGVCRAYVTAQLKYASMNPDTSGGTKYALKFKSTTGTKDGLYWPAADNEPASPFGALVAQAQIEGYHHHRVGPQSFHGYYFTILTRQGDAAPGGKMDYETNGNLTGGFALLAYPEHWDQSGVMTFMIDQDGKLYQRNLGPKTSRLAAKIKEYNPNDQWTLVQDQGVLDAVTEK